MAGNGGHDFEIFSHISSSLYIVFSLLILTFGFRIFRHLKKAVRLWRVPSEWADQAYIFINLLCWYLAQIAWSRALFCFKTARSWLSIIFRE